MMLYIKTYKMLLKIIFTDINWKENVYILVSFIPSSVTGKKLQMSIKVA